MPRSISISSDTTYLVVSSDTQDDGECQAGGSAHRQAALGGQATASSQEQEGSGGGGLVGMLVEAVVSQIANSIADKSYDEVLPVSPAEAVCSRRGRPTASSIALT